MARRRRRRRISVAIHLAAAATATTDPFFFRLLLNPDFPPLTTPLFLLLLLLSKTTTAPKNQQQQQIDRALRDINRVCQADDILTAWRADRVFTRPAIRRVVEAKASARRLAARRFKAHMRWVMARRERGF